MAVVSLSIWGNFVLDGGVNLLSVIEMEVFWNLGTDDVGTSWCRKLFDII